MRPILAVWDLFATALKQWYDDEALRLGAALSFYTLFSLAPLLIVIVAVVGVFYEGATFEEVQAEIADLVGSHAADAMAAIITDVTRTPGGRLAAIIGLVTLFLGSTWAFSELRFAMHRIWHIRARPFSVWALIRDRIIAFAMVMAIAIVLLVSMVASTLLATVSAYFDYLLPGAAFLWYSIDVVASLAIITLLFAALFRYVPDVRIPWRDVWLGAAISAVLFVSGKSLIGLYLAHSAPGSAYGAAGSAIVLLLWVYYSSQAIFFGVELAQVYNTRFGKRITSRRAA